MSTTNGQRSTSSFSAGAPRMGSSEALKAISGQLLGKDSSVHGSKHGSGCALTRICLGQLWERLLC